MSLFKYFTRHMELDPATFILTHTKKKKLLQNMMWQAVVICGMMKNVSHPSHV